jgi:glycine cleavage system H protein
MTERMVQIEGYRLAIDRAYDPDTHVWVERRASGTVRVGLDPLGLETMGTLAQLDLLGPGTAIGRGEALGTLEAEKFVGPLASPLSGTVVAVNDAAIRDPRLVHGDPFGVWLLELAPSDYETEASALVTGDGIAPWFTARLADYRLKGVLAE